jgi:hypothetical protein
MAKRSFQEVPEKAGAGLLLRLPFDPNSVWGQKERHHVCGTVGGCVYRGELKQQDGSWHVKLGPAWVRDNPLEADRPVEVVLEPEGPQMETMPEDVAGALAEEPQAKSFFDSLPSFYRKNFMRWIEQAKRPETRAKRIAETVRLLRDGQRER